ncbi:hypothetical protein Cs7R123_74600 [Catellatospora sp. TT07R-123]|uniref:hypothetical protein n=1 Tax=Catellatospora sp. TT07R-123 TaxID=2733863 RepID=UPI001B103CE7|nr:hypothetical protein [Catellatospora sp. TT07R-123]GHJ50118.1 hypothetical protein Cs7R123_74600 [Catellatospora sp. TT07R-123]
MSDSGSTTTRLPASLLGAVALLVLQALAVTVVAGVLLYADLTAEATDMRIAAGVTVFAVAIAAWLGVGARLLLRRSPRARGPVLALELLLLAPAYFMITGGQPLLGWTVLAVSGGVIACVLAPATTRTLGW